MIGKEKIDEMKEVEEVIITNATFKKSVVFKQDAVTGYTIYEYKGKDYKRHEWLLTYGHEQYERLIA